MRTLDLPARSYPCSESWTDSGRTGSERGPGQLVEEALAQFLVRREHDPELTVTSFARGIDTALRAEFSTQAQTMLAGAASLGAAADRAKRVAGCRVLGVLGSGGTATVYAAASATGLPVAVKVLHPHLADLAPCRARLVREAHIARLVRHPALAAVHGVGEERGRPYLLMDLVEGVPLHQALASPRHAWRRDHARVARAFAAVAEALHAAHGHGFVHRDLKPGNLMLTPDGRLVLLDFGLSTSPDARLTRSCEFLGTPAYMAPEQVSERESVSPATDVYALGAVLYECVTGRPAVAAGALPQVLAAVRASRIAPAHRVADVDPRLSAIVARCLARRPRRRYPDAAALAADLTAYAAGAATVAHTRRVRARRTRLALLVSAVALGSPFVGSSSPYDRHQARTASAPLLPRELFHLAQEGDERSFLHALERFVTEDRRRRAVR